MREDKEENTNEIRQTISKTIPCNSDVVVELAYERRAVSGKLADLNRVITMNPESVSEYHKSLCRKQAEAVQAYKEVLGERIKDLIDN